MATLQPIPQQFMPVMEWVIFLSERIPAIIAVQAVLFMVVRKRFRWFIVMSLPLFYLYFATRVYLESWSFAEMEGYDMSQPSLRQAIENYVNDGAGNVVEILEGKKHPPVFGSAEFQRYFKFFLGGSLAHNTNQDAEYLPEAYNKGDDWFEATLGEPMVYTGAIYTGLNETIWKAQLNKLDFIAHGLGVKPGDRAMEIGCGWGRLTNHLASKGAHTTGITMSSDQFAYAKRMTEKLGNTKLADFVLKNFFDLEYPAKTFDVISSVEMAEHVGINNYHTFLRKVHYFLKDEGTFYIQVAGLQRGYAEGYNNYQDIVWGMFMDEHVFPGADASCPMGWVVTKLEQAGFEPQSVHNLGYHYSLTLDHWRQVWEAKKDDVVKVYGERSWRRWQVFLRWSVLTAKKGGSTVQMIVATKAGNLQARINAQNRIYPGKFQLPAHSPNPGGGPPATKGIP